jgi:hypothetical protein
MAKKIYEAETWDMDGGRCDIEITFFKYTRRNQDMSRKQKSENLQLNTLHNQQITVRWYEHVLRLNEERIPKKI